MLSRTSCFNRTIFRKNLTRFAPAWGLYTLCLVLGTLLIYGNGGTMKQWHFANNMSQMPQYMALINVLYAPMVAQLLFGDLYNSRMCNALHAMPIRREGWYFSNLLSGLVFSLLPGTVMAVLSCLLCGGSLIQGAWQIPWYTLAASTLQFICYFGLSVFAAMCAGNRLGMLLIYALLNAGAFIGYFLVDTVYTPMLYGVVTSDNLAEILTPVAGMLENNVLSVNHSLYDLRETFGEDLRGAASGFVLISESWGNLLVWAVVGLGFTFVGMLLYRERDLECAGDAMAFKVLNPVFQVLGAVVSAAAVQFFLENFLGFYGANFLFLAAGLAVGWFACRMLIERSTRVFGVKNWIGLAAMSAAIAVSLFLTHVDILGIDDWLPEAEEVKSVRIGYMHDLTDKDGIRKIIDIHAEAIETRLDLASAYTYVQNENGEWVPYEGVTVQADELAELAERDGRRAFYIPITYTMENGREVSREYSLWADSAAGDNYREVLSRWEQVSNDRVYLRGKETGTLVLDMVMADLECINIEGLEAPLDDENTTKEERNALAQSFLEAVKLDCEDGTMAQQSQLHRGHFRREVPDTDAGYYWRPSISVSLRSEDHAWHLDVFPDSVHTVRWLQENGLLVWDTRPNILIWY